MSFDLIALRSAVAQHGRVVRVVVVDITGSVPREIGATMMVWADGQSGTIGGGALEYEAMIRARSITSDVIEKVPLGPALGQCCGGVVTLVSEIFDAERISTLREPFVLRNLSVVDDVPLTIQRMIRENRNGRESAALTFSAGWLFEPITTKRSPLWIYGAGHVGRALVNVLTPLESFDLTWIDTHAKRFPEAICMDVTQLIAENPAELVKYAPVSADHLIFTYSHTLDLEICHQLLEHNFRWAGLIGSRTKWARFRSRLSQLGHPDTQISRIECPIGQPELGKHPQSIAIGIAANLLSKKSRDGTWKDKEKAG